MHICKLRTFSNYTIVSFCSQLHTLQIPNQSNDSKYSQKAQSSTYLEFNDLIHLMLQCFSTVLYAFKYWHHINVGWLSICHSVLCQHCIHVSWCWGRNCMQWTWWQRNWWWWIHSQFRQVFIGITSETNTCICASCSISRILQAQ